MSAPNDSDDVADQHQFDRLNQILSSGSLDETEQHVTIACQIIDQITIALMPCGAATDAQRWVKALSELKKQTKPTPVIIGVVGSTGAGKSSLINAMLDEERIVPTSGFRACTAVITELAWNDSDVPEELYKGEIEFIQPGDWATELKQLQGDFIDSKGQASSDPSEADSDAGVAWAKVKGVYPHLSQKEFTEINLDELSNDARVREVLGTTKLISAASVKAFYSQLQQYVSSAGNKSRKRKFSAKNKTGDEVKFEYWPLVKMVRVYTKAHALRTGARIVDLPGIQDANAARAAVAARYIQNCSALWIVAPITRAVSDKAAQDLLGQTFKLQAKYDNSFSKITFIASKTDDINVSETIHDFGDDSIDSDSEEADFLDDYNVATEETKKSQHELEIVKTSLKESKQSVEGLKAEINKWRKLADKLAEGKSVFTPGTTRDGKLRPRDENGKVIKPEDEKVTQEEFFDKNGKKTKTETYIPVPRRPSAAPAQGRGDSDGSGSSTKMERKPLSHEQIQSRLTDLNTSLEKALGLVKKQDAQVVLKEEDHRVLQHRLSEMQPHAREICIRQRNIDSEEGIQKDFARGIKELDVEDESDFDPEENKDYKKIGASLPVFCISSTAYQTLNNRFQHDSKITGFATLQDTGIPQLQDHAVLMTGSARMNTARGFLNIFFQQLNSLSIWAANQTYQSHLEASERETEMAHIRIISETLRENLIEKVNQTVNDIEDTLSSRLTNRFGAGCVKAEQEAIIIAQAWGNKPNDGGMFWATYKATCRRDGEFSGSRGYRNLNEELIAPLKSKLANAWEKMFSTTIPKRLEKSSQDGRDILQDFHSSYITRMESKLDATDIIIMNSQIKVQSRVLKHAMSDIVVKVNALQRGANRLFTPAIMRRLTQAYNDCVEEHGRGSFRRMKDIMVTCIEEEKAQMFQDSCESVEEALILMCDEIKQDMLTTTNEAVNAMISDYLEPLAGRKISPASKAIRSCVQRFLSEVHSSFRLGRVNPIRISSHRRKHIHLKKGKYGVLMKGKSRWLKARSYKPLKKRKCRALKKHKYRF
ncbi:hypothetical protein PFICI_07538 [Pestalotiopsis fici W106-1]|uniref:G domain-containing protein n=1 Tax=Pestalotiopsis fici (strain W106-1 / CGMCC3.15140) TaxID=1229662 RepID=W3X1W6_PESFW|nr:uncharacterized protein PFICI_07538 [Pestalotiopsis fici W106-1]ETS80009.1 hypothetical protein PFICI_07538 [Pestalotiopsis fici W106-1]